MRVERGTLLLVGLDPTLGHEQRGTRPCVAVSDPAVADDQRYPLIAVVPLTGTPGEGLLYPRLEAGPSGLRKPSFALVEPLLYKGLKVRKALGEMIGIPSSASRTRRSSSPVTKHVAPDVRASASTASSSSSRQIGAGKGSGSTI